MNSKSEFFDFYTTATWYNCNTLVVISSALQMLSSFRSAIIPGLCILAASLNFASSAFGVKSEHGEVGGALAGVAVGVVVYIGIFSVYGTAHLCRNRPP